MTHSCACGFFADDLTGLDDHLDVFPEDEHYELARDTHPPSEAGTTIVSYAPSPQVQ
jgi:hypothetical protein